MTKQFAVLSGMVLALGQFLTSVAAPAAENQAQTQTNDRTVRESYRPNLNNATRSDRMHNQHSGTVLRASQIIGHGIVNAQDENIGEINDLVLDPQAGKVRYAAVTYGGFMGIGDEMFAVPWEAIECGQDPNDQDDYLVRLNVSKEQLENAKGFDQDNWPNFADRQFTDELDRRYNVQRDQQRQLGDRMRNRNSEGVNVDVNRRGVNVDVDGDN